MRLKSEEAIVSLAIESRDKLRNTPIAFSCGDIDSARSHGIFDMHIAHIFFKRNECVWIGNLSALDKIRGIKNSPEIDTVNSL